jgi:hypothetical protein
MRIAPPSLGTPCCLRLALTQYRSVLTNLNNLISENSGSKAKPIMTRTGVFDGQEINAPYPAHTDQCKKWFRLALVNRFLCSDYRGHFCTLYANGRKLRTSRTPMGVHRCAADTAPEPKSTNQAWVSIAAVPVAVQ